MAASSPTPEPPPTHRDQRVLSPRRAVGRSCRPGTTSVTPSVPTSVPPSVPASVPTSLSTHSTRSQQNARSSRISRTGARSDNPPHAPPATGQQAGKGKKRQVAGRVGGAWWGRGSVLRAAAWAKPLRLLGHRCVFAPLPLAAGSRAQQCGGGAAALCAGESGGSGVVVWDVLLVDAVVAGVGAGGLLGKAVSIVVGQGAESGRDAAPTPAQPGVGYRVPLPDRYPMQAVPRRRRAAQRPRERHRHR